MNVEQFFDQVLTVRLTPDRRALDIIDQTLLPGTIRRISLETKEEIWEAIKKLRVRGAPAIGVSAAYGMAVLSSRIKAQDFETFYREFISLKEYLASSRPTAVNLFWALNRMDECAKKAGEEGKSLDEIRELLYREADAIQAEDVQISRNIGEIGFGLLKDLKKEGEPVGILTHCNAGTLATAKYGTATAPMYIALEHGWAGTDMHVYCDETRPLLQGARLTSFELNSAGITTTVQCDNMASLLMKSGKIDIIFVGCDRVAANGDAANKIGTSGVAILAKALRNPVLCMRAELHHRQGYAHRGADPDRDERSGRSDADVVQRAHGSAGDRRIQPGVRCYGPQPDHRNDHGEGPVQGSV